MRPITRIRSRNIMCVGMSRVSMISTSIRNINRSVTIRILTRRDGIRGDRVRASCMISILIIVRVITHMRIHIRAS